jgi:hypothetical protein
MKCNNNVLPIDILYVNEWKCNRLLKKTRTYSYLFLIFFFLQTIVHRNIYLPNKQGINQDQKEKINTLPPIDYQNLAAPRLAVTSRFASTNGLSVFEVKEREGYRLIA